MKKLFSTMLIALLCAGALFAQERIQKVITIKNGNMTGILKTVHELAPASNLSISTDNQNHIILSGTKEAVSGFEEIIKQLDVAPPLKRDVETTVYMVLASMQLGSAAALTPELEPVVKQLKAIFNYKSFRLLDSFALRSRDGEHGETNGFIQPPQALPPNENLPASNKISYQFQFNRMTIEGAAGAPTMRFDELRLSMRIPVGTVNQVTYTDAGISTNVDVPAGKQVVVGKTSGLEGADSALILVISAKVVD